MWDFKIRKRRTKKNIYIRRKFRACEISLRKDSSNSCKQSSINGFKKVVQNNRIKSVRKPGREKGHRRSAPLVSATPDRIVHVSKFVKEIDTQQNFNYF